MGLVSLVSRVIYSLYFYTLFSLVLFLGYPLGRIFTLPKSRPARLRTWQRLGAGCLRLILALSGMRFSVHHPERIPKQGSVIFAANHESLLDGPLLFLLIGRPSIAVTAPRRSFPLVWRIWMKQMGFIEVSRDLLEAIRFPEARGGSQAIEAAVTMLQGGFPLIIFPEGHREFQHHLLPFHTGISRVAAEASLPIVPIALSGVDKLWPPGGLWLRPGQAFAMVGRPLPPPGKKDRRSIIHHVERLERQFVRLLPSRYIPDNFLAHHHLPRGRIAAFFDFDRTMYPGYAAAALARTFYRRHLLNPMAALHILSSLLLEAFGTLHHFRAMERGLIGMRGWLVAPTERTIMAAYRRWIRPRIFPAMRELILRHRKLGHKIFLVTEEIEPVAAVIARDLHCDGYAATRLETEAGRYTGRLKGALMYEHHKAEAVRRLADGYGIDLEHSFAYADSPHDLPMLRAVGHPVCVNPKHQLLSRAKKNDWKVVHM